MTQMRHERRLDIRWIVLIYLAVIFAPLAMSALLVGPPRSFLDEIASGAGMIAFVLLLVEFTLSGRFKWLSRAVAIDTTMQVHRLIGLTALAAALVHPFLYRADRNPARPWDPTRELTITNDFSVLWTGILAWLLLPSLVLLAQTRGAPNYRYEGWRWLHGVSAVVIAGLALHHILYAGRYAAHPFVAGFWITTSAVVAVAVLWLYSMIPLRQARRRWRVVSVEPAAERIWRVEIEPEDGRGINYKAGQFVWLNLGNNPLSHRENPFSIASAPSTGPNLQFLIKELGDSTSRIRFIPVGTVAYIDGPHGSLTTEGRDLPGIALIAGGIGIAPLLGIFSELTLSGDPRPRRLLYADNSPEQIVGHDTLQRLGAETQAEVVLIYDRPPETWRGEVGHIDAALVERHFTPEDLRSWLFVLCGPPPMLNAVETALRGLGVPAANVLSERFDYD